MDVVQSESSNGSSIVAYRLCRNSSTASSRWRKPWKAPNRNPQAAKAAVSTLVWFRNTFWVCGQEKQVLLKPFSFIMTGYYTGSRPYWLNYHDLKGGDSNSSFCKSLGFWIGSDPLTSLEYLHTLTSSLVGIKLNVNCARYTVDQVSPYWVAYTPHHIGPICGGYFAVTRHFIPYYMHFAPSYMQFTPYGQATPYLLHFDPIFL